MTIKYYKVYFARTAVGEDGASLSPGLNALVDQYGQNLPGIEIGNERFQVRDLTLVGSVWKGTFAKLRDDAPNIVSATNQEHELTLDDGDHVIEKCHFLFRLRENLVVWQTNRSAGGLSRFQEYLGRVLGTLVTLPQVMNEGELNRVMAGQLYEVDFAYDRPAHLAGNAPVWNQNAFNMMDRVDAAHAKFLLRAPRKGGLAESAKQMVRQLVHANGTEKIRVRLTDETEPIELFMAPLKGRIQVEMMGRYPAANDVFQALEGAYDLNRENISNIPT